MNSPNKLNLMQPLLNRKLLHVLKNNGLLLLKLKELLPELIWLLRPKLVVLDRQVVMLGYLHHHM